MKILIVGPSWVGDAVMSQTLLKLLIKNEKPLSIDILAPSWASPIFKRMKEVNTVIEMPFTHGDVKIKERKKFADQIKKENYDQAIVLPNSLKSALIPYFAGIPKRTGWRGEMRYLLLNDLRKLNKIVYPRMVDRFCALGINSDEQLSQIDYPSLDVNIENISNLQFEFGIKEESKILSNFKYKKNLAVIHSDSSFMPKNVKAWSSWNSSIDDKNLDKNSITYWLNLLQNLKCDENIFLTLNPYFNIDEKKILKKVKFTHPYYDQKALDAQSELIKIQNQKDLLFCGSYFGYGFHEDGIKSSIEMLKNLND